MALEVYNGTNPTTAEALSGVADCIDFADKFYGSNLSGSTAEKEATIRRVNTYMMGLPWAGSLTHGYAQSVPFPRTGLTGVPSGAIPPVVIQAQHMLARAEHKTIGALSPDASQGGQVKREKLDVLEVEYFAPASADASRVLVTGALELLAPYLKAGALDAMGLTDHKPLWGMTAV